MKVTRVSVSYSRTTQPAPYESKVAKAEIEYSFAEDDPTDGAQALKAAMTVAVNQVHETLGLDKIKITATLVREAPEVLDPKPVEPAAEKPKRGRPAGFKNNPNPPVEATTAPAAGTVAEGGKEAQAKPSEAAQTYTVKDAQMACRRAAEALGDSPEDRAKIHALIAAHMPEGVVPGVPNMPGENRAKLVAALEVVIAEAKAKAKA